MKLGPLTYCNSCGHGLEPATLDEIKADAQTCGNCGKKWLPNRDIVDYCYDLEARIKFLESWVLGEQGIRRKN